MEKLEFKCHNGHSLEVTIETKNYFGFVCNECDYPLPFTLRKECDHRIVDILVEYKNGAFNRRKICTKCLEFTELNLKIDPNKKYEIRKLSYLQDLQSKKSKELTDEITPMKEELNKIKDEIIENKRNISSNLFWDLYDEYLMTKKWKEKRLIVLARDNYLCQACRINKATQVHHLTYKHFKNEPLFDLISICKPCHDQLPNSYRK